MFTIEDSDPDPVNQGSRGVGICLEDGVEIICRGRDGRVISMSSSLTILAILDCIWTPEFTLSGVPEVMDMTEATVKLGLPTGEVWNVYLSSVSFCNSIQRAIGYLTKRHRRSL